MKTFRGLLILFISFAFTITMLSSCATESENVALGTAAGAGIGASVTHDKWKGAVIGGILGAIAGEAYHQIQQQAINEAVSQQKPVAYQRQTSKGWERVEADPISNQYYNPDRHTTCQKVHVKIIENGRIVKDRIKEVCKGTKETNDY
jgi:outer membrane lipoprotein SlyB